MTTLVDVEKQSHVQNTQIDDDSAATSSDRDPAPAEDETDVQVRTIRENTAIVRFLANLEKRIDGLTTFEAMGVERVPEDKRTPPQKLNVSIPISVSYLKLSGEEGRILGFLP
jgi:hypothetical protein